MFRLSFFFFSLVYEAAPPEVRPLRSGPERWEERRQRSRLGREGFYFPIIKKHLLGADELRRGWGRERTRTCDALRLPDSVYASNVATDFPWRLGRRDEARG